MSAEHSPCLVPVSCDQLQVGMYVAELDRSWLHTSFRSHGFLITRDSQIDELRRVCEYVYVDPLKGHEATADIFTTGLAGRSHSPAAADHLSAVDQTRTDLRRLVHRLATTVHSARHDGQLELAPLRHAILPLIAALAADPDTLPWLVATELKVGFLYRRAIGSAVLLALFGRMLGFRKEVLTELGMSGLLLDIGKVTVPVPILAKPGALTDHERDFVYRHVRRGLYIVRMSPAISSILEAAVLGHHERIDGRGYPSRLKGTHIPLFARMAGIVDTYDAMTQDRRYAPAHSPHEALRLLNAMRGKQFDAALVQEFIHGVGVYPTGSWVQLADGRLGLVRRQVTEEPLRPRIALVSDSAGRALPAGAPLWQPIRRADIERTLAPADVHVSSGVVAQAVVDAADLAA